MDGDFPLDPPALNGSPAHAFASHRLRARAVARNYALTHPLNFMGAAADENNTIALIAHLQAVSDDPEFKIEGQELSRTLAPNVLRSMNIGQGRVGTTVDQDRGTFLGFGYVLNGRPGDYDAALKGLMVIACRYRHLLDEAAFTHVRDVLMPPFLPGTDVSSFEKYSLDLRLTAPPGIIVPIPQDAPETENHMLLIASSIYLANQLLFDKTRERKYNNSTNGLGKWLLNYMHVIASHDFLEFNARPYQRYSLHALLNLHEFAREDTVRVAAQIVLDYIMVKFAVSSNWQRRICPFRRLKEHVNRPDNAHNELLLAPGQGNDAVAGFFRMYAGPLDVSGTPLDKFPASWGFEAVIGGLAAYRPPPAAYILAMQRDLPPFQHRFYHGARPKLPASDDQPDGGVEIYYRSPSFLLTAGGMFLNSGYGSDEFTKFKQVAVAQSTTLLPTQADLKFADLIRFDPYPDERRATNTAVHRGFACGANLRPSEKKVFDDTTTGAPGLAAHNGRLHMTWKGSGNEDLNVAKVHTIEAFGLDGIESLEEKTTVTDTSELAPALASHGGRLFLAWKGSGNDNLNLMFSEDNGATFKGKRTLSDTSHHAPALVSHNGRLFLAWTGRGDGNLNVAKVTLFGNTAGGFGIEGIEGKVVLGDTSEQGPAIVSHNGRLFLAWKGSGNDNLNLMFSEDNGATFTGKLTLPGDTSHHAPALASHNGRLFLAYTGRGDGKLNVGKVTLIGNTAGGFGIEGLEGKVVLDETSDQAPGLTSHDGRCFLAWKGSGNENLNLMSSRDGSFQMGPWHFTDRLGFYVAVYRTPPAQPDQLDTPLENLGLLYAMEKGTMSFDDFKRLARERNATLPEKFEFGGHFTFHAPDDRHFAFWLHPSLDKYTVRVVATDDVHPAGDFTTLPLVEGDFLRAPGGHDGRIEIRQPGCEHPLVLDFRNPEHPDRKDNAGDCPEPWLERARALFDYADLLSTKGREAEAQQALADRLDIYRQLAALGAAQGDGALARLLRLAQAGIDFSVPEADLRAFLGNPEFTPYPAISGALLTLLGGKILRQPVFLDVIVFNYENTPGVASPRREADVDSDLLTRATLEGYNERYGESAGSLQEVVQ
ncbi:MAG: sialidase family protein [Acetobacteraceae bacterium]